MPDPKPDLVPWDAPTTSTPLAEILRMKEEAAKHAVPIEDYPWRDPDDPATWEWEDVDDIDIE